MGLLKRNTGSQVPWAHSLRHGSATDTCLCDHGHTGVAHALSVAPGVMLPKPRPHPSPAEALGKGRADARGPRRAGTD